MVSMTQPDLRCPDPQYLRAFARGEVTGQAAQQLRSHLQNCPLCSAFVDGPLTRANPDDTLNPAGRAAAPGRAESEETRLGKTPPRPQTYPFLAPPTKPDEIGRLGDYRVLRLLGQGGMGQVFHAEDLTLGRPVALKVLRPELQYDPDGWQRFLREARCLATLKHDHLVTVYRAGQEGDVFYFAMELLQGESLAEWMRGHPPPDCAEVIRVGREIAGALACLHRHHLVHRDLKPANLWLEGPGRRVKLLDLGIARHTRDQALTLSGEVLGTPGFMAPEQARGQPVDARSDLFSLGCVLYKLCSGASPFAGTTLTAVLTALAVDDPVPLREHNPRIPEPLADLIMQLLAKQPRKRPQTAEEVVERLGRMAPGAEDAVTDRTLKQEPTPAATGVKTNRQTRVRTTRRRKRKHFPWAVLLVLVAVAGLAGLGALAGAVLWFSQRSPQPTVVETPRHSAPQTVCYLTDLKEVARENWPFQPPKGGPKPPPDGKGGPKPPPDGKGKPKPPPDGKGGPKPPPDGKMAPRVKGVVSPHGIFMHPPGEDLEGAPASLSYSLGKDYQTFLAEVSLGDESRGCDPPCKFSVYGDGKLLWQSRPVASQTDAQQCQVSVQGVDILRIEVVCPGPPGGAHAIWIEPRVVK
jgi:serine/threonine protein kinase